MGIKKFYVLTDHEIQESIKCQAQRNSGTIEITFFFSVDRFCDFVSQKQNILFVCDHPLRKFELLVAHKCKQPISIIEMSHGMSVARGFEKLKKFISNFFRRILFLFVTRKHQIYKLKHDRGSGLLYLSWLIDEFVEAIAQTDQATQVVVFATSGAGRYTDKDFKLDTKMAFVNALQLCERNKYEIILLAKNGENLDYLSEYLDQARIVRSGFLHLLKKFKGNMRIVCHDQSTMVMEAKILKIDGWTYSARFSKRSTYAVKTELGLVPGELYKLNYKFAEKLPLRNINELRENFNEFVKCISQK